MHDTSNPTAKRWPLAWAFLLSASVLLQGLVMATHIPVGQPPDELAHISYVKDAISSRHAMPDYRNGKIINSGRSNYLGHPPLYYSMLGVAGKVFSLDPVRDYKWLRSISVVFVAAGFFFFVASARNLGVGPLPPLVMLAACCATPMYAYLAGSVNNDTLMYFGVALFTYGATRSRLEPGSVDLASGTALVAGLIVAALTKATGATFLLFFAGLFLLLRPRRLPAMARDKGLLACALAAIAVCGAYYSLAWLAFGTPLPKPAPLYALSPPTAPLGVGAYVLKFVSAMWDRLPVVVSHASISPYSAATRWCFYTMFVAPIIGWGIARPGARKRDVDAGTLAMTDAFMLALFAMLAVHVVYVRNAYLHTGLLAGWQPRYYYFAIPFAWVPFFVMKPSPAWRTLVSGAFAVFACIAFWASVPTTLAVHARTEAGKAAASRDRGSATSLAPPTTGQGIPVVVAMRPGVAGHLDDLSVSAGTLRLRGWAFDPRASAPARRIWILAGDRYLGSIVPNAMRPDVGRALSEPRANASGFRMTIRGVPAGIRECNISVAAELSDGSLSPIRRAGCS
jgi:hypothetical protein